MTQKGTQKKKIHSKKYKKKQLNNYFTFFFTK